MIQRSLQLTVLLAMALASCQQPANDSNIAIDNGAGATNAASADVETLPPSEAGGAANAANVDTQVESGLDSDGASIPAPYRGRWGLVPADCTSTRGDAKGLVTISATGMRFYEATATLKERRPAIATSFAGLFAFSGEGQEWERVETLTADGDTLKRSSTTPRGETGEELTYTRCKA